MHLFFHKLNAMFMILDHACILAFWSTENKCKLIKLLSSMKRHGQTEHETLWLHRFVPESVRWSVMRRRYIQADTTLRTAARFNGVSLPKVLFPVDCKKNGVTAILELKVTQPIRTVYSDISDLKAPSTVKSWMDAKSVESNDVACAKKRYSAVDMFRTPKLRQWAFVFAYNW